MSRIRGKGSLTVREGDRLLCDIGTRIRRTRRRRGLSQGDAAHLIGTDRNYLGRIERGEVNASALFLVRIARVLDCETGEFFPPIRRRPRP